METKTTFGHLRVFLEAVRGDRRCPAGYYRVIEAWVREPREEPT